MNHTLNLTYEEIDLLKTSILIRLATIGAERHAFERQCDKQISRTYITMRNVELESRHQELSAILNKLNEATKI